MRTGPTPRQLARASNIARIKGLALEQLAASGAAELSLRAIARELNIVSSAIYRYYPGRDELITDLIVDAYDDLADRLETVAHHARRAPRRRFLQGCQELRAWARAEPHRFALIYGSAIPGYRAPADTIAPAGRVIRAFCAPVVGVDLRDDLPDRDLTTPRALTGRLRVMGEVLDLAATPATLLAVTGAFARVIGLLTLELNGHLVGGFEPADDLFATLLAQEAARFAW